jgi:hypothetical protein
LMQARRRTPVLAANQIVLALQVRSAGLASRRWGGSFASERNREAWYDE